MLALCARLLVSPSKKLGPLKLVAKFRKVAKYFDDSYNLRKVNNPGHTSHIRGQILSLYKVYYFSMTPWPGNVKSIF
ncbi:hypothetical protein Mapa_010297 [Marchantia paleacea]|nr:hypothetical protein Mapa_010297 [Marchantia paleacea]